jgi:hypothetical protein
MAREVARIPYWNQNGTVVFIVLLLEGSGMPDSRHKLRNAGQVFVTNRETRIFAAKYA